MNVITDIFNIISISYYALMSVYIPFTRAVVSELCNPGVLMMEGNPGGGDVGGATNPTGAGRGTGRRSIPLSEICNDTDVEPLAGRGDGASNPNNPSGASNPTGAGRGTGGASNPSAAGGANTTGLGGTLKASKINGPIVVEDPNHQYYEYKPGDTNQPLAGNVAKVIDHQRGLGTSFSRFFFEEKQERFFFDLLRHQHPEIYDRFFVGKHGTRTANHNWYARNSKDIADVFRNAK